MKIAIITLIAATGIAMASPYLSSVSGNESTDPLVASTGFFIHTIDISGMNSWDLQGDLDNEHLSIFVGFHTFIHSIGWDINIMTQGASWLSEPVIGIEDELFVNPGFGEDFAGTGNYSSGGMIDLVALDFAFFVSGDGMLNIELFESFDDIDGEIDAVFGPGSYIYIPYFPTPGAAMTLALGGLIAGRRRRTPWPAHTA